MRLTAIVILMFTLTAGQAVRAQSQPKPNVIFIICDDLGYGDLGVYGQQKIKTPNIDRLAGEGMLFTQHYSGSPVCGPSRSCLLTGQHTGHTPIRANPRFARDWGRSKGDFPLPADLPTWPKLFKQAGYTTAALGKWGLGRPGTSGGPEKHGFDSFFGYADHTPAHEYYPSTLWRDTKQVPVEGKQYSHDLFAAEALDFVRKQKDKPFLLYAAFTIPHGKLVVPDLGAYANESWKQPQKTYAAMMTRLDGDVGRLMALLKELGIEQNTLIIFTSDNGPQEGKQSIEFFDSNGPFRGAKRDVYEGGIRVPLLARWPAKIQAGTRSDHVSANWDFLPTFAEMLGVKPVKNIDGLSMLPTLQSQSPQQKQHEFLYWEFNELGGQQAVRMGDWKGVRRGLGKNPNAPLQLYNLQSDPSESKDVAAQHPNEVQKISQLMAKAYVPNDRYPRWAADGQADKEAE